MDNKPIQTVGIWTIKPGQEAAFIGAWSDFAQWMTKNTPGLGKGYLLQDAQNPSRFISTGAWDSVQAVQMWRESEAFQGFVGKAMPLCDDFQPGLLNVVATSE